MAFLHQMLKRIMPATAIAASNAIIDLASNSPKVVGPTLRVLIERCIFVEWRQQCSTKTWLIMRIMAKGRGEGSVIKMN